MMPFSFLLINSVFHTKSFNAETTGLILQHCTAYSCEGDFRVMQSHDNYLGIISQPPSVGTITSVSKHKFLLYSYKLKWIPAECLPSLFP